MNNIARAFVFALAITGAAAVAQGSARSNYSSPTMASVSASAFPIPTCPPDDPNGCGICGPSVVRK